MKNIIAIIILVAATLNANAQNATATAAQSASLALSNAIQISFTNSNSSNVSVAFNSAAQMNSGVETIDHEVLVQSNLPYSVTVNTPTNFTYSGNANTNNVIPVWNKFKMRIMSNNTGGTNVLGNGFSNVQNGNTTLFTNCPAGGNNTFEVRYKLMPGSSYASGTYAMNMVYTATQQ